MMTAERFFRIEYCLLMILGLFAYSQGYEYYLALEGRNHMAPLVYQLGCLTVIFLLASVFWTKQRWTITLALVCFSAHEILVSPQLRPYSTNLAFAVLVILSLTDRPLRAISQVTALYYFTSGLTKILWGQTAWFSGQTLKLYLQEAQLLSGDAWPWSFLIEQPLTLGVLSTLVAMWEISFPLALRPGWMARFYVASAVLFHGVIYFIFGANFFFFVAPALVSFWPQIRNQKIETRRAISEGSKSSIVPQ